MRSELGHLECRGDFPGFLGRVEIPKRHELSPASDLFSCPDSGSKLPVSVHHSERESSLGLRSSPAIRLVEPVLKIRSLVEVLWVAARRVVAGMKNSLPVFNRGDKILIGESVRLNEAPTYGEMPVAALVCRTHPHPAGVHAACEVAITEKPFDRGDVYSLRQGNHLSLAWPLRVTPRAAVFASGG